MSDGKKILIAEDEKPMARALELKLKHEGFLPTAVFDGEEALALIEKETFDLLLVDIMMPKVNGFKVLETLKEKGSTTPVMILSNLSQESDAARAKELGARDFFIKSNTPLADIVEKVKEVLS